MSVLRLKDGRPQIIQKARLREEFVEGLLGICGDVRRLWIAQQGDTTTSTTKDRNQATVTWSESLAAFDVGIVALGEGFAVDFNGTDEEGDMPDAADISFGDGANDNPFSVVALVNQGTAEAAVVLAKEASATDEEWVLETDASGNPQFVLTDESASATIGRQDATALSGNALISGTYDGAGLASGVAVYLDGVAADDTDVVANTYVAMEAGASTVQIGHHYTTAALFWDGTISFILICAKELSADEQWRIKELVNWYFGLSL